MIKKIEYAVQFKYITYISKFNHVMMSTWFAKCPWGSKPIPYSIAFITFEKRFRSLMWIVPPLSNININGSTYHKSFSDTQYIEAIKVVVSMLAYRYSRLALTLNISVATRLSALIGRVTDIDRKGSEFKAVRGRSIFRTFSVPTDDLSENISETDTGGIYYIYRQYTDDMI